VKPKDFCRESSSCGERVSSRSSVVQRTEGGYAGGPVPPYPHYPTTPTLVLAVREVDGLRYVGTVEWGARRCRGGRTGRPGGGTRAVNARAVAKRRDRETSCGWHRGGAGRDQLHGDHAGAAVRRSLLGAGPAADPCYARHHSVTGGRSPGTWLRATVGEGGHAMKKKPAANRNSEQRTTTSREVSRSKKQGTDIARSAGQARWARAKKTKTTKKGW
jgi:hypothetical protein